MALSRIPEPLSTKGDLYTYSTVPAKLAVGSDGDTLVADSATTTGLRWQGSITSGKNAIINGGMDIWQRGTSSASNGYTTVDRFYCSSSSTCTFAQDTTYVPDGIRYAVKGTAGATTNIQFLQAIETANALQFANKTVTLSAYVGASTSTACEIVLAYSTSVDNSIGSSWTNITPSSGGSGTATSTVSRISGVFAVPSTAKSLRVLIGTTSTVANTVVFAVTGVQLELGSVATTFSRAGGNIAGELAACQRYYFRLNAGDAYTVFAPGQAYSSTQANALVKHPVTMRVKPSSLETASLAFYTANGSVSASGTLSINAAAPDQTAIQSTNTTGLVAGDATQLVANNSTSAYVGLSAEL